MPLSARLVPALLGCTVLLLPCGAAAHVRNGGVCRAAARADVARAWGIGSAAVVAEPSQGSNAMPQCEFRRTGSDSSASVTVNVDNGPQANWRLDRAVEEGTQIFGVPPPGWHAPESVSGLGPYASWFPNEDQLKAANDRDLITVTVDWPGAPKGEKVSLARRLMKLYLRRA